MVLALIFLLIAIMWGLEAQALRGEITRIAASRLEVLNKLVDGKAVRDLIIPGTLMIVRDDAASYICGKVRIGGKLQKGSIKKI